MAHPDTIGACAGISAQAHASLWRLPTAYAATPISFESVSVMEGVACA